jgi:hypothetical protein
MPEEENVAVAAGVQYAGRSATGKPPSNAFDRSGPSRAVDSIEAGPPLEAFRSTSGGLASAAAVSAAPEGAFLGGKGIKRNGQWGGGLVSKRSALDAGGRAQAACSLHDKQHTVGTDKREEFEQRIKLLSDAERSLQTQEQVEGMHLVYVRQAFVPIRCHTAVEVLVNDAPLQVFIIPGRLLDVDASRESGHIDHVRHACSCRPRGPAQNARFAARADAAAQSACIVAVALIQRPQRCSTNSGASSGARGSAQSTYRRRSSAPQR